MFSSETVAISFNQNWFSICHPIAFPGCPYRAKLLGTWDLYQSRQFSRTHQVIMSSTMALHVSLYNILVHFFAPHYKKTGMEMTNFKVLWRTSKHKGECSFLSSVGTGILSLRFSCRIGRPYYRHYTIY